MNKTRRREREEKRRKREKNGKVGGKKVNESRRKGEWRGRDGESKDIEVKFMINKISCSYDNIGDFRDGEEEEKSLGIQEDKNEQRR